jgi:peptide chain release factor subunit 1
MTEALQKARRLLERTGDHPVLSVYFDLDPSEFGTQPARATQIRSLVDEARSALDGSDTALSHDDRRALAQDIERVESFLTSDDAPVSGARALAVFCSGQDGLFEAVQLHEAAPPRVVIDQRPYLEPIVAGAGAVAGAWCVCLVNRSTARILAGPAGRLWERGELDDDVKGQHQQGGWSQARYQRSVDVEVDRHLEHVAEELRLRMEREPYETLVLGGPDEAVSRLAELLHNSVKPALSEHHLSLDVDTAGESDVRVALEPLIALRRGELEQRALERLRSAQGGGPARAVSGPADTRDALTQRRVETLLISPDLEDEQLRAEAVEQALLQDAGVIVFREPVPDTHLREGIGALLRF